MISGIVQDIQAVSVFTNSALVISNPQPGGATGLTVEWTLLGPTDAGDKVVLIKTGFALGTGLVGVNVALGGSANRYVYENKCIFIYSLYIDIQEIIYLYIDMHELILCINRYRYIVTCMNVYVFICTFLLLYTYMYE